MLLSVTLFVSITLEVVLGLTCPDGTPCDNGDCCRKLFLSRAHDCCRSGYRCQRAAGVGICIPTLKSTANETDSFEKNAKEILLPENLKILSPEDNSELKAPKTPDRASSNSGSPPSSGDENNRMKRKKNKFGFLKKVLKEIFHRIVAGSFLDIPKTSDAFPQMSEHSFPDLQEFSIEDFQQALEDASSSNLESPPNEYKNIENEKIKKKFGIFKRILKWILQKVKSLSHEEDGKPDVPDALFSEIMSLSSSDMQDSEVEDLHRAIAGEDSAVRFSENNLPTERKDIGTLPKIRRLGLGWHLLIEYLLHAVLELGKNLVHRNH